MGNTLKLFGDFVKYGRELLGITQDDLAQEVAPGETRNIITQLEQGRRLPAAKTIANIGKRLKIPAELLEDVLDLKENQREQFEELLSELVGREITSSAYNNPAIFAINQQIKALFNPDLTTQQSVATFNRLMTAYKVPAISVEFYKRYFADGLGNIDAMTLGVSRFQKEAILLFSTFADAYETLNTKEFPSKTFPFHVEKESEEEYKARTHWESIERIPSESLKNLGYISAETAKVADKERKTISTFLHKLAAEMKVALAAGNDPRSVIDGYSLVQRRRMDSLLRKYKSKIEHGLFSSLFPIDIGLIEREAEELAPKDKSDLQKIAATQKTAEENLANYLTADYLDVYIATSMRTDADFASVSNFITALFTDDIIRPLKLRYFDPTQSWIGDRVAKGLVEALMLKRAKVTIYMAQKGDTFGKDSEASVSLGQGKPVIVYVPSLIVQGKINTEDLGKLRREELVAEVVRLKILESGDIDESLDSEALLAQLLTHKFKSLTTKEFAVLINRAWADCDLPSEVQRIDDQDAKSQYRAWIDTAIKDPESCAELGEQLKSKIVGILVANSIIFEKRARLFREVHPLALQVIISSGMLNGILVCRTVASCAKLLKSVLLSNLTMELIPDSDNYKLIEKETGSVIRVISKNKLLSNAFHAHFRRSR